MPLKAIYARVSLNFMAAPLMQSLMLEDFTSQRRLFDGC